MAGLGVGHVAADAVTPNGWNPNKMSERAFEAQIASICTNGFVDPITVRETDKGLEIVDGEHRWRAVQEIKGRIEAGTITIVEDAEYDEELGWVKESKPLTGEQAIPSVADLLKEIPAINLGPISTVHAQRLTLILNNTRGESDVMDLANVLAQIAGVLGESEVGVGMVYTKAELADFLEMAEFDWNDYDKANAKDDTIKNPLDKWITIVARLTEDQKKIVDQAVERMESEGSLHDSPEIKMGQVLELLAAEYVAGP